MLMVGSRCLSDASASRGPCPEYRASVATMTAPAPLRAAVAKAASISLAARASTGTTFIPSFSAAASTFFSTAGCVELPGFHEHGHGGEPRHHGLDELGMLRAEIDPDSRQPGDVPAGMTEAGHDATCHQIHGGGHDDGDAGGRLLQRLRGRGSVGDDDFEVHPRELGGELGETLVAAIGIAPLDDDIPPLDVSELTHALRERLGERVGIRRRWARSWREEADAPHLALPLGQHDSRSEGYAGAQRKERAQGIAPAHSTCEVGDRRHGGIKGHCTVFRERLHRERLVTRCPRGENPGYGSPCALRSSRTCTSAPKTSPLMASWSSWTISSESTTRSFCLEMSSSATFPSCPGKLWKNTIASIGNTRTSRADSAPPSTPFSRATTTWWRGERGAFPRRRNAGTRASGSCSPMGTRTSRPTRARLGSASWSSTCGSAIV